MTFPPPIDADIIWKHPFVKVLMGRSREAIHFYQIIEEFRKFPKNSDYQYTMNCEFLFAIE